VTCFAGYLAVLPATAIANELETEYYLLLLLVVVVVVVYTGGSSE
jgi:hypothetical protein